MYRVEALEDSRWRPIARGLFRTRIRALTNALCRTASEGQSHRVVDLDMQTITDLIPPDSLVVRQLDEKANHHKG
jgi:hypothetical protein